MNRRIEDFLRSENLAIKNIYETIDFINNFSDILISN